MTAKSKIISSENLSYNDIPDENAKWHEISMFAHTFDILEYNPYSILKEDFNDIDENSSISYLRARLYAEQRRWNHYGRPIDDNARLGVRKILNILKEKYRQKHI